MILPLVINGISIVATVALVSRKYGSLINPIALFGGFLFIATFLTPLAYVLLHMLPASESAVNYTTILSSLYFVTIGATFLVQSSPFRSPIDLLVRLSRPFTTIGRFDLSLLGMGLLALQFVFVYVTIMIASGAGLMWLTNSREAYSYHRAQVGVWWSLALGILMLLFLAVIVRWGQTSKRVFLLAALFCFIALRLGSKGFALQYFIIAAFFVQYRIRPIRTWPLLCGSALLLCLLSIVQLAQGTADRLIDTLGYFDYFWHSARLIEGFGHRGFHFQYGAIMLSNLWFYLPRAVYPDKPLLYGLGLLDDWVYPGLAKHSRYTPGLLQWAVGYGDFGVMGVVGVAAVQGLITKGVFEYFLEHRDFVAFVLLIQVGFVYSIELFPRCPFPIYWLWFMAEGGMFWVLRALAPKASLAVARTAG